MSIWKDFGNGLYMSIIVFYNGFELTCNRPNSKVTDITVCNPKVAVSYSRGPGHALNKTPWQQERCRLGADFVNATELAMPGLRVSSLRKWGGVFRKGPAKNSKSHPSRNSAQLCSKDWCYWRILSDRSVDRSYFTQRLTQSILEFDAHNSTSLKNSLVEFEPEPTTIIPCIPSKQ